THAVGRFLQIEQPHEALLALVLLPIIESVDAMKAGENAVLPRMIGGTILRQDNPTGRIAQRMKVGTGIRLHHVSGEFGPIALVRRLRANNQPRVGRFNFEFARGLFWRVPFPQTWRAWNELRAWVAWWPIEGEKS